MAVLTRDIETRPAGMPRFRRAPSASGHRLVAAFESLERFPALSDAHAAALRLLDEGAETEQLVVAFEADAALTAAVLRAAALGGPAEGAEAGVAAAVQALSRDALSDVVRAVPTFDFFDRSHALAEHAGRLRLHALGTRRAVERIREELGVGLSGALSAAALLHDIGKVVLALAYDHYSDVLAVTGSPEERLAIERQALGIDHAVAGGVLLRRVGVPREIGALVEAHHAERPDADVALLRLADMLAHHSAERPIDSRQLVRMARIVGLSDDSLRRFLGDPYAMGVRRRPKVRACPLSRRQLLILKLLASGKTYKQISAELGIAASTVRNHLHHAYNAMGVRDRAQAVLLATREGWL